MNLLLRIILLSFISTASFSSALVTPALPHISTMFSVTHQSAGGLVSLFLVGYVLGQLIYGPLANRFGRLNALRAGFVINLFGLFLSLLAIKTMNFHLLLFSRFVTAIGSSSGLVCTFILIREYFNEEQAKHMLSFAVLSFSLGVGIAVLLGGMLIQYASLMACFELLAAYGVISLLATYLFNETLVESQPLHIAHLCRSYLAVFKSKRLVYFSLVLALCSSINYCYSTASPMIATKLLGLSPSEYGLWNGMNIAGMIASSFLASRLLKRFSAEAVIKASFLGLAACLSLFATIAVLQVSSPLVYFAVSFCLYLMSGLFFPSASFCATSAYSEDKGSASSVISFLNMGTACVMVVIMGLLPFSALVSLILILALFLALLVLLPMKWSLFSSQVNA